MRCSVDVRWSPAGTLEGEVGTEGGERVHFHGVIELIGLLEASLGRPPGRGAEPAVGRPERRRSPCA